MKFKNIFKKETIKTNASVEPLNKTQLEKVIGGTDETITSTTEESALAKEKKGINAVNVKLA